MLYIYIATVVVMLGLILFTSLAILTISQTTGQNIKKKTMELTSLYDYLLEEHSQELRQKKHQIEQLDAALVAAAPVQAAPEQAPLQVAATQQAPTSTLQTVENIGKASYQHPALAAQYQEIRAHFSYALSDVLAQIPDLAQAKGPSDAECLLGLLSYETIYSMSFLEQAEQLACMQEVLPAAYAPLLEAFLAEHEAFSSLDFYTYLKEQAEQESTKATVYVSPNVAVDATQQLDVAVNDEICEGIQVEVNHLLYDFAIEKKEIGWVCQH